MTETRPAPVGRIASVDLVRGAVMLLMAIDHVRVYSKMPAGGPSFGVFFTRWITHFCAPAFVFLAGTSVWLYRQRQLDTEAHGASTEGHGGTLTTLLISRGIFLVALELTVLRLFWTFNPAHLPNAMAGVMWMLGWCFILMALVVRIPTKAIAAFGVLIVFGHNFLGPAIQSAVPSFNNGDSLLWKILYSGFWQGPTELGGGASLIVLYSIIPWIGVMALGYAFGEVFRLPDSETRFRALRGTGLIAIGLFLALRTYNGYGDPNSWEESSLPMLLAILNTAKYPASLQFLLMTLGPTLVAMAYLDRARGRIAEFVSVFGRVPMFYYVLHIPLIHLLAIGVSLATTGGVDPWLFDNHPMGNGPAPDGYMWSLGTLYLVTAVTIAILYFPCKWYAAKKSAGDRWWYRYL